MKRNLILIHRGPEYERDFDEIAARVNAIDRGITVYHLPYKLKAELPDSAWQYPTLTVALTSSFRLPVKRGPILRNAPIGKLEQQEIFRRNGIATPPALAFRFGMKLDPILFGEFVILKTGDLGLTSQGAHLHLFRRRRAEEITPSDFPVAHPLRHDPNSYIVQRFIDTGVQPNYFRVSMFMNKILFAWQTSLIEERPPLTAPDLEIEKATVDIKGGTMKRKLVDCPRILEAARQVSSAFPSTPLLAIDIVVQEENKKIWVLEVNAGGNSWHFSSEYGKDLRRYFGEEAGADTETAEDVGRLCLIHQFDGFDLAAEALVAKVHLLAA